MLGERYLAADADATSRRLVADQLARAASTGPGARSVHERRSGGERPDFCAEANASVHTMFSSGCAGAQDLAELDASAGSHNGTLVDEAGESRCCDRHEHAEDGGHDHLPGGRSTDCE